MTAVLYLDHAATTPLDPAVREAMRPWLEDEFGNPSSRHRLGVRAAEAIENARRAVARALGAPRERVLFTSGGTEANNLAVLGHARARVKQGRHVLVGPTEHPCVRAPANALRDEGFDVETLRLTASGALDLEHAASRMREDTVLVAQMLVQNEVGSIYPVRELARLARSRSPHAAVHVDGVQAFGKVDFSFVELGVDSLAIAAHKIHGPKGTGALVLRSGLEIRPLVYGGNQEEGLRSGTENVAGIVGLGVAATRARETVTETMRSTAAVRAVFVDALRSIADSNGAARVLEPGAPTQPLASAILAVILPGVPSEVRMHHLEARGVIVSAGSACQAKKSALSPSLAALGLSEDDARCMLRFSFARTTTIDDARRALAALDEVARSVETAR
ncbi:MAG: cysteine desulfurase family protein [Planctomycetota bacterium]